LDPSVQLKTKPTVVNPDLPKLLTEGKPCISSLYPFTKGTEIREAKETPWEFSRGNQDFSLIFKAEHQL
jgi:hypothetical protein